MKWEEIYVGLDVHKEMICGTAMNKDGEVLLVHEFPSSKEALREFFKEFPVWDSRAVRLFYGLK